MATGCNGWSNSVSALIHAATMVTAGIYMIARSNVLYFTQSYFTRCSCNYRFSTAVLAANNCTLSKRYKKSIGLFNSASSLVLCFLHLVLVLTQQGVFHVMTHAFFKALLFLGAGSVIHAMGGEQDITKMGGLSKKTARDFLDIYYWRACNFRFSVYFRFYFPKTKYMMATYAYSPLVILVCCICSYTYCYLYVSLNDALCFLWRFQRHT
jgi:NADH-quinone oxidoreductase subunit L